MLVDENDDEVEAVGKIMPENVSPSSGNFPVFFVDFDVAALF